MAFPRIAQATNSTAQATPSTAQQPPRPTCSQEALNTNPISGGAGAGIAIGAFICGSVLAALAVWIFMKRSKSSDAWGKRRKFQDGDAEKSIGTQSSIVLEDNLLERADDSHIKNSMQELNELIDQHVENNYHLHKFKGNEGDLECSLFECGYTLTADPSIQAMVSMLQNAKTRKCAIRQLIASTILKNIDYNRKVPPEISLLPLNIAAFCNAIPPVERQPGCDGVFDKAFIKWRHLSAFLLEPVRSNREAQNPNETELQSSINRNVALMNGVLNSFIHPGLDNLRDQQENLSAVVFKGASLGLLLFSQPSVWLFRWKVPLIGEHSKSSKSGAQVMATEISTSRILVVFPALGERVETHGRQKIREVVGPVKVWL